LVYGFLCTRCFRIRCLGNKIRCSLFSSQSKILQSKLMFDWTFDVAFKLSLKKAGSRNSNKNCNVWSYLLFNLKKIDTRTSSCKAHYYHFALSTFQKQFSKDSHATNILLKLQQSWKVETWRHEISLRFRTFCYCYYLEKYVPFLINFFKLFFTANKTQLYTYIYIYIYACIQLYTVLKCFCQHLSTLSVACGQVTTRTHKLRICS